MTKITLREIHDCTTAQKETILIIRNQDSVRTQMYTDHCISIDEHRNWLASLKSINNQLVFVVLDNEKAIGVVSLKGIDKLHSKSDWAFYLDETTRGGLGAALEYALIEFVFEELKLDKLNCEVIETNQTVVRMHGKFSFVEEGFKRENIIKNNERIGVYLLGLTKSDWIANKSSIYTKYKAVLDKFKINIEHTHSVAI